MYRKKGREWTKHVDFMLLDILCIQLAFIAAYIFRFGTGNPYMDRDYRIFGIAFLLIDFFVEIVSDSFKNVLKRGYFDEFLATCKHVILVEVVTTFYLFTTQMGDIYSRISYYIMVAIVLCTFNRIDCLRIALQKYEDQTVKPDFMVIVNNASTDGTKEYLDSWKEKTSFFKKVVIHNEQNLGGSGGFSRGVEEALKLDCDYMFLADDDAYAETKVLEELHKADTYLKKKQVNVAALCTAIYNGANRELSHRCIVKQGVFNVKFDWVPEQVYSKRLFKVDIFTFVGACIKKSVVEKIGLPKTQYFIYYDDAEYCMRIREYGEIYCVPGSIMHHDIGNDRRSSWKDYYDTRNWIDLVKAYFPKRNVFGTAVKMYFKRCSILAKIFRNRDREHRHMCWIAIHDGLSGRLGIHEVYRPGSQI